MLAYADRERIMPPEVQALKLTLSGDPVVTVGGRVAASWSCGARATLARVEVTPHVELRRRTGRRSARRPRRTARVCEPERTQVGGHRGVGTSSGVHANIRS